MPDLFERKTYRLYLLSEKPNIYGLYQRQGFNSNSLKREIDEKELEDAINDLKKDIYGKGAGGDWIEISEADVVSEEETFYIKIDRTSRLEIRNIIGSIDLSIVEGVYIRYFILLNTISKKFRWVMASKITVYSDSEKKSEDVSDTDDDDDDSDHELAFLKASGMLKDCRVEWE